MIGDLIWNVHVKKNVLRNPSSDDIYLVTLIW
jgi:hypothetical protein